MATVFVAYARPSAIQQRWITSVLVTLRATLITSTQVLSTHICNYSSLRIWFSEHIARMSIRISLDASNQLSMRKPLSPHNSPSSRACTRLIVTGNAFQRSSQDSLSLRITHGRLKRSTQRYWRWLWRIERTLRASSCRQKIRRTTSWRRCTIQVPLAMTRSTACSNW